MTSKVAEMTARVRGEEIPVRTEAMLCNRCGFQVLTDEQSDAYTIASADAYREKHGLLTSRELKEIRSRLGMSQQSFARFLKVGVASVKRWEAGMVQDEAMDELIKVKSDLPTARANVRQLESQLGLAPSALPQTMVVSMLRRDMSESEWDAPGGASCSVPLLPGFMGSLTA
jgi:putative zinc finger/helix-turn-helix YgiT family protein